MQLWAKGHIELISKQFTHLLLRREPGNEASSQALPTQLSTACVEPDSVKVRLPNIQVNTFSPLTLYYKPPWGTLADVPYSGKLLREKTFANWWKYDFRGKNFHRLLTFAAPKDATPQNLQRKLLRIATKPQNSWKFLPRKFSAIRYHLVGLPFAGENFHELHEHSSLHPLNVTWWLVQYLQTVLLGCYWHVLPCQWEGDNIHQSLTTWIWLDAPYAVLVSRDHTCSR